MNSWLNTVKKARESETTLKQTLQRLGNDAATKDVLQAARRLSKKAKVRTSNHFQNLFNFQNHYSTPALE
jgi:hypothetical protein